MLNAEDIRWLRTSDGEAAFLEASRLVGRHASELSAARQLRRTLTAQQSRAVLALLEGRRVAGGKLENAPTLFIDRAAAEQASPGEVARYTAARLARAVAPGSAVADLGSGAGADALALAAHVPVVAVDIDEARVAMVAANAAVSGVTSRVQAVRADLMSWAPPSGVGGVWLDPSRRDERGRRLDPSGWTPTLDVAIEVARRYSAAGIKLAPGIDTALLPSDGEVEFISLHGRLVEGVLWLGAAGVASRATATVLPRGHSMARVSGAPEVPSDVRAPGAYLYDPDPAVGRAGLVRYLARAIGGWQLSEEVAYLSSDRAVATGFARRFRVLDVRSFSDRAAHAALRTGGSGRVEVMRRGAPVDTNALEHRLNARLQGGDPVHTLALTRIDGRIAMLLCVRDREVDAST